MSLRFFSLSLATVFLGVVGFSSTAQAASYTFPVIGESSYSNDYKAPRDNGCHCATDIIAKKGQPIVSATDGVIDYVWYPQPSWGYTVVVRSTAGEYYWYLHINNDNPGTDDGKGGGMHAYAADIKVGNPIKRGQLIGWVGDSGNAENTVPHLHLEIHKDRRDGPTINPYSRLKNDSSKISKPVNHPELPDEILPFNSNYKGTVNVARGDVTNDGREDIIAGAEGPGIRSRVRVYDSATKQRLGNFLALSDKLSNGVDVAVGDVDGDGKNELIAAVRGKHHAKIAIYKYNDATKKFDIINDFIAYRGFNTIPRVDAGDIDGDGIDEIIVGTGAKTKAIVNVFDDKGQMLKTFMPFGNSYNGGVDVAAGNLTGTLGADEIIVGPLAYGSSRTIIYDASQPGDNVMKIREFYAHGSSYRGGIRLSIGEVNRRNLGYEIMVSANNKGGRPVARVLSANGKTLETYVVLEEWWRGYHDIAAGRDGSYEYSFSTGGNRRGSIR